ncbi:MAG: anti-sigma factor domain-containing protein [Nocardioidaceae bacterium]
MSAQERRVAHEEFDELAVGWALGALEPDDESRFSRHAEDCQRCQQTVDDAQEVTAALAVTLPPEQPSPALRARLVAAVSAEPRAAEPEPPQHPRRHQPEDGRALGPQARDGHPVTRQRQSRRWSPRPSLGLRGLALAAALALIAGLGVWNVVLRSEQAQSASTVAAQAAVLDALNDSGIYHVAPLQDHEGAPVGMVVVHDGAAQVMADGLAPNDTSDMTFVLWGLGASGSPEALGTFDVLTPELDVRNVSSTVTGLDQYDGYAISLESGRQAPSSPTETVATGTVGS